MLRTATNFTTNSMMRKSFLAFIFTCALAYIFTSACAKPEGAQSNVSSPAAASASPVASTKKVSSADVVMVTASKVEAAAGESVETDVRLAITNGYHINANPPSSSFQIATELIVEPSDGITPGKLVYPPSIKKKFPFNEEPLAVYESEAIIKLPLRVEKGAVKGDHILRARLRVQACDDQACFPPRTIETSIPVTVK